VEFVAASEHALKIAMIAAQAAFDKKAENIVLLDVSEHLVITDIFLIASADNERQVGAIVDAIEAALDEIDVDPIRREGNREGRWVLLDYFDIVVHVQQDEERSLYDLERLWSDCPRISVELV
jgi:ribosome-associated protein